MRACARRGPVFKALMPTLVIQIQIGSFGLWAIFPWYMDIALLTDLSCLQLDVSSWESDPVYLSICLYIWVCPGIYGNPIGTVSVVSDVSVRWTWAQIIFSTSSLLTVDWRSVHLNWEYLNNPLSFCQSVGHTLIDIYFPFHPGLGITRCQNLIILFWFWLITCS